MECKDAVIDTPVNDFVNLNSMSLLSLRLILRDL